MSQEKFWMLLSKKLSHEASAAEIHELENLILTHPEWQFAIQNLEDLWKHQPVKDSSREEDAYLLHLNRMAELNIPFEAGQLQQPVIIVKRINKKWFWAAAASIVAIASLFFLIKRSGQPVIDNSSLAQQENEISTRPGSKSRVQLPDGSVVILNAGSKLTYNKDFGIERREVTLTGEGFFDVKKMTDKPFIIHTSAINIKVLGTVFNVKAYPEDKKTETSLLKGSIEVTIHKRPNDKIILSPSEKLVIENNTIAEQMVESKKKLELPAASINTLMSINKLKYATDDSTVAETQWIDNKLVFREESFDELAVRLERWYNVEITISDNRLKGRHFSGIFENETIEQALEALKISVPFRHEQTGNKIIIHR